MKKIIGLIGLIGLLNLSVTMVVSAGGLPPQPPLDKLLYIWNKTGWRLSIVLIRGLEKSEEIPIGPHGEHEVVLKKRGIYKYYIKGYDPWYDQYGQIEFVGEESGQFKIKPGITSEKEGKKGGYHLVVKDLSFGDGSPHEKYFGGNGVLGKYESRGKREKVGVQTYGLGAEVRMNWPLIRMGSKIKNFLRKRR